MAIIAQKFKERLDLDLDTILKELRLLQPVYERILQIAMARTDEVLPELQDALERGDAAHIQRTAHELKGTYGNMRVGPLARLAAEMDVIARDGDVSLEKLQGVLNNFKVKFLDLKGSFEEADI